jgi:O-acetyl-ADP-ribose deacetylase (regulator of RNase III)
MFRSVLRGYDRCHCYLTVVNLSSSTDISRSKDFISKIEIWTIENIFPSTTKYDAKVISSKIYSDAIINPANSKLIGASLPYFPRGGPVPLGEVGSHSVWGGMEAGPNMVYPTQSIDGRIHAECGAILKKTLGDLYPRGCPVGRSVLTPAFGNMVSKYRYKYIIHTVPPLYNVNYYPAPDSPMSNHDLLVSCYLTGLDIARAATDIFTIITPVLGSGTAGFGFLPASAALRDALHMRHKLESFMPCNGDSSTGIDSASCTVRTYRRVAPGGGNERVLRIMARTEQDAGTIQKVLFPQFEENISTT